MMEFHLLSLTEVGDPEEDPSLLEGLDEERVKKILAYRQADDRRRSLFAGYLIRHYAHLARKRMEDLRFTPAGKPYFEGFFFNLSHSGGYVLGAAGDETEVGCDIEKAGKADREILCRCFTLGEQLYVERSEDPDIAFYEIWTRKEAYLKMRGLSLFEIGTVDVIQLQADSRDYKETLFKASPSPEASKEVLTYQCSLRHDGHVLCVTARKELALQLEDFRRTIE